MTKRNNIEDLKKEYIGKTFNLLTVLDVYRNDKSLLIFKCQCKCGNIKDIQMRYVLSNHSTSCGCYNKSKEKSDKAKTFWKNNPDKAKERGLKTSEYYKNNPDKAKERGLKISEYYSNYDNRIYQSKQLTLYYKNNPGKAKERGLKISEYYKNNPDKLTERRVNKINYFNEHPEIKQQISDTEKQYYVDHPEKLIEKSIKRKEWHKNNPEFAKTNGQKYSDWCKNNREQIITKGIQHSEYFKNNPDICKQIGQQTSEWYKQNRQAALKLALQHSEYFKELRKSSDLYKLLDIIHKDDIDKLLNGEIKSFDNIRTKCPNCNNYCAHMLSNVFIFSRNELKLGHAPLCNNCLNNLTTSLYESEIEEYIKSFYSGKLIKNDRTIISPQELDLYYPDKRIAIEFNGDYWHSDIYKSNDYHINKFNLCKERCILLISIFESEWNKHKEEIKEYIKDTFNNKENKLSFNEDHTLMNNNYPSINHYLTTNSYIESYYKINNYITYACGYSKLT